MKLLAVIAATLLVIQPASACVLYGFSMSRKLPAKWESKPLVARVQPLELVRPSWARDDNWFSTRRIRVRVVEALKGFSEGEIFVVQVGWGDSRCSESYDKTTFEELAKGTYYVGGDFQTIGGFAGQNFRIIGGERVFSSFWRWQDYKD